MKKIFSWNSDRFFYLLITIILSILFLSVLYPCVFVVAASFSSGSAVQAGKVVLWPVDFSIEGYKTALSSANVMIGFRNSIFYTVAGTIINIVVNMLGAYALSRKDLPGRNLFSLYFAITMFFGGGMIPTYLLIRDLGMLNTIWSLLLPGAVGVYNMIMARTFIQSNIPQELLEASQMDGCSDFRYLLQVVLPLSKAIIAVLVLFFGVSHWNSYFSALIYIQDRSLHPLTIFLREILSASQLDASDIQDPEMALRLQELANVMKYALIVVSMFPILILYPFIQKYFVQGVMIGSVKG